MVSDIKSSAKTLYQKASSKLDEVINDMKSDAKNLYNKASEKAYQASEKFNEVA